VTRRGELFPLPRQVWEESMDEIRVTKEFLDTATTQSAKALVGRVFKRFEVLKDDDARKAAIKELIYENFRDHKTLLESFSKGSVQFKVKTPTRSDVQV
jgi:hypothetical protein